MFLSTIVHSSSPSTGSDFRRQPPSKPRSASIKSQVPLTDLNNGGADLSHVFMGAPHSTSVSPLSPLGDACSREDLTAINEIFGDIGYKYGVANEDVSLGSWFIGLDVEHIDDWMLRYGTPPGIFKKATYPEASGAFAFLCGGLLFWLQ